MVHNTRSDRRMGHILWGGGLSHFVRQKTRSRKTFSQIFTPRVARGFLQISPSGGCSPPRSPVRTPCTFYNWTRVSCLKTLNRGQMIPHYQASKANVLAINVVNDCAERGVKLSSDFLSSAKNEEHYQNVLQVVEHDRKRQPNLRKRKLN
jgi:hypothetical protein